jgi:hypothetical protein
MTHIYKKRAIFKRQPAFYVQKRKCDYSTPLHLLIQAMISESVLNFNE